MGMWTSVRGGESILQITGNIFDIFCVIWFGVLPWKSRANTIIKDDNSVCPTFSRQEAKPNNAEYVKNIPSYL